MAEPLKKEAQSSGALTALALSLSFPTCRTETCPRVSAGQGASSCAQRGWRQGRECGPQSPW